MKGNGNYSEEKKKIQDTFLEIHLSVSRDETQLKGMSMVDWNQIEK